MRLIYLVVPSLVMTFSLAQAEQKTGMGYNESAACQRAHTAAISHMVRASEEVECKYSNDDDCDEYIHTIFEYYTVEDCVCTDSTPDILNDGKYDKSKRNPDRWVCTVNYHKIPEKW